MIAGPNGTACDIFQRKPRDAQPFAGTIDQRQIDEGWVLTCQARCTSKEVRIEYPD